MLPLVSRNENFLSRIYKKFKSLESAVPDKYQKNYRVSKEQLQGMKELIVRSTLKCTIVWKHTLKILRILVFLVVIIIVYLCLIFVLSSILIYSLSPLGDTDNIVISILISSQTDIIIIIIIYSYYYYYILLLLLLL